MDLLFAFYSLAQTIIQDNQIAILASYLLPGLLCIKFFLHQFNQLLVEIEFQFLILVSNQIQILTVRSHQTLYSKMSLTFDDFHEFSFLNLSLFFPLIIGNSN